MAGRTTDWRATVARVIGDEDAFAAEVAEHLGEPYADVRATVRLWLLLHAVTATTTDLEVVVGSLRARAQGPQDDRPERPIEAATLDDLYAWTIRETGGAAPDARTVVGVQQAAGAIAARSGERLVLFLARLAFGRRHIWDRCVAEAEAGRLDRDVLTDLGQWLLLWTELTSLAVTDGYRAAEREILVRDAEARRAALDELLGVVTADPTGLRRTRRVASRFGLDPDRSYRVVVVAPADEADPTPDRPGIDSGDLALLASRIGHLLGAASVAAEGAGSGIRLPAVLAMRDRVVILAGADQAVLRRVPEVLDRVLGNPADSGGRTRWLAIGSGHVDGVGPLAAALADVVDAVRTAELIGRRGWIPDPEALAVERLLLGSPELGEIAVARELGPLLADERMGEELVETLQVFFDAGENMRETARRLHLANRTVAYRIERIESLLGGPLDGELRSRLTVALLVRRLHAG